MIQRLDNLWHRVLNRAHHWILGQVYEHCRRDRARRGERNCRGEAVRRLERELERQRGHLN